MNRNATEEKFIDTGLPQELFWEQLKSKRKGLTSVAERLQNSNKLLGGSIKLKFEYVNPNS